MDYNPSEIKELLEKYWEGETTLEEESAIRKYLSERNYSNDHSADQVFFNFLNEEREMRSSLEYSDILAQVANKEKSSTQIFRLVMRIAAVALIAVSAFFLLQKEQAPEQPIAMAETFETPEEAYAQVKEALLLVSSKMNRSQMNAAAQLSKAEQYTEIFK